MVPRKYANISRGAPGFDSRKLPDVNCVSGSSPGITTSFHVLNCSDKLRSPSGVRKIDFLIVRFHSLKMCGPRAPGKENMWSRPWCSGTR
jgi:hypothetical protein